MNTIDLIIFAVAGIILLGLIILVIVITRDDSGNYDDYANLAEDIRMQAALRAQAVRQQEMAVREAMRQATRNAFEQMSRASQQNNWNK